VRRSQKNTISFRDAAGNHYEHLTPLESTLTEFAENKGLYLRLRINRARKTYGRNHCRAENKGLS